MGMSRAVRYLGLDRNPLRRRSDRIEALVTACAVATMVIAGPAAAWGAGIQAYRDAVAGDSARPGNGVAVEAVVMEDPMYVPSGAELATPSRQPPLADRQVALENALTVGTMVLWSVVLAAAGFGLAIRRGLDRHRLTSWQDGWSTVEPRWTGRQSP